MLVERQERDGSWSSFANATYKQVGKSRYKVAIPNASGRHLDDFIDADLRLDGDPTVRISGGNQSGAKDGTMLLDGFVVS